MGKRRSSRALLLATLLLGALMVPGVAGAAASQPQTTGRIAVFKELCTSIGQQDTCNGRDDDLDGFEIDFQVFRGATPGGELVETITVTLGENAQGTGNVGSGSQGRAVGSDLLIGTFTVCEVELAMSPDTRPDVVLDAFPRPTASQGGSSGGGNQEQTPGFDNCITVTLTGGTAELKFLDLRAQATTTTTTTTTRTGTATTGTTTTTTMRTTTPTRVVAGPGSGGGYGANGSGQNDGGALALFAAGLAVLALGGVGLRLGRRRDA